MRQAARWRKASAEAPVRPPPQSSVLVPFTVASTMRNLGPQLFGVLGTGAVEHRVHGSITLDTLGIAVPFSCGRRSSSAARPGL